MKPSPENARKISSHPPERALSCPYIGAKRRKLPGAMQFGGKYIVLPRADLANDPLVCREAAPRRIGIHRFNQNGNCRPYFSGASPPGAALRRLHRSEERRVGKE